MDIAQVLLGERCTRAGARNSYGTTEPKNDRVENMTHTLNAAKTVAVATDVYWIPIDENTPRSVKVQLLGKGGVAVYGNVGSNADEHWTHWCPLPKLLKETT